MTKVKWIVVRVLKCILCLLTETITRQTLKYKNKKIKTINIIWKDK